MNIRPFEKPDIHQTIALYQKCFAEPPWFEEFDPKELEAEFINILSWPDGVFFIAELDKQIVGGAFGFALSRKQDVRDLVQTEHQNAFYLADLFVDITHRNCGIGKLLTDKRVQRAIEIGFETGVVRTSINQPIIQHLYITKRNYQITGTQDTFSTKVIGGITQQIPDKRIIMVGPLTR